MLPNWILVPAAIELIGGLVFLWCIATAVPEGPWLFAPPLNRNGE
jgi:hypothetical protein